MKRVYWFFIFIFFATCGYALKIHSTADLMKIMAKSKLLYQIKMLDTAIVCKNYSDNLNYNNCYRVSTSSKITTYQYKMNDMAKPLFEKAEAFFKSNSLDSALVYYKLTLAADSSQYFVMTYIGQIYDGKPDYANAIDWYKKAIGKNYIDYMAHWFLADDYMAMNDVKKAVDEIVIAQILNRNNPRIKKSMTTILGNDDRNTMDWYFTPQIAINKISDKTINVAMNEKWVGYAIAKAIWTYEPGYKESMGDKENEHSTLEDDECLISLLTGLENAKIDLKNDPQLQILKEAAENGYLQDYVLYEILLPQTPFIAFQLPEQTILDIRNYILKYRNPKRQNSNSPLANNTHVTFFDNAKKQAMPISAGN